MAITTTWQPEEDYVLGWGKPTAVTRLVKTDIIRQGISGWLRTILHPEKPHDPKTPAQLGVRALVRFIYQRWHYLTQQQKDDWLGTELSGNMARWINLQPPSRLYPATELSDPIAIAAHAYTGGRRYATLSLTPADATSLWGIMILRSATEIVAPDYTNAIALIFHNSTLPLLFCDTPLPPGTWHYRAAAFNDDGTCGPLLADDSVSVS